MFLLSYLNRSIALNFELYTFSRQGSKPFDGLYQGREQRKFDWIVLDKRLSADYLVFKFSTLRQ